MGLFACRRPLIARKGILEWHSQGQEFCASGNAVLGQHGDCSSSCGIICHAYTVLTSGVPPLQYHNIFALVRELGIPSPFTDWTTSGFWSPEGLTTEAPVFSRRPQLPTMLGQFVHTLPLFRRAPCLVGLSRIT